MTVSDAVGRFATLAKRGTKQTCENETCGSRFYDLKRVPSICPYCGASCNVPAHIILDFETLGKQRPRKFNRPVGPQRSPVEVSKVEDDISDQKTGNETEIPSAAEELLIEIDDDDAEVAVEATSETT
jgi:uncharacterized protein (TIGR02300 family)